MARLIDADGIAGVSAKLTGNYDYDKGVAAGAVRVLKAVENAPTIDAIPVEWLRKYEYEPIMKQPIQAVLYLWEKEKGVK